MSTAARAKLELIQGPASPEILEAIARLYGPLNTKYQSVDFCDRMFNQTPYGHSFHAVARSTEDRRIVGIYNVIAMEALIEGQVQKVGKGEAIFVEEEFRKEKVDIDGAQIPIGLAFLMQLHAFAVERGCVLIHNMTNPDVGKLSRASGSKPLTIQQKQFRIWLKGTAGGVAKYLATTVLSLWQRMELSIGEVLGRLMAGPMEVSVLSNSEALKRFSRPGALTDTPAPSRIWSCTTSPGNLQWFQLLGYTKFLELKFARSQQVILSAIRINEYPQGAAEWIEWLPTQPPTFWQWMALACAMARFAQKSGAGVLAFSEFNLGRALPFTRHFLRLAWAPFKQTQTVFIRAKDKRFHLPESMDYNAYYYTVF